MLQLQDLQFSNDRLTSAQADLGPPRLTSAQADLGPPRLTSAGGNSHTQRPGTMVLFIFVRACFVVFFGFQQTVSHFMFCFFNFRSYLYIYIYTNPKGNVETGASVLDSECELETLET